MRCNPAVDVSRVVEMDKNVREHAHAAVEKAAAHSGQLKGSRQLTISTEVLSGSPKRMILEDADAFGADLIVVGSHGRGIVERFLLGSGSLGRVTHRHSRPEYSGFDSILTRS